MKLSHSFLRPTDEMVVVPRRPLFKLLLTVFLLVAGAGLLAAGYLAGRGAQAKSPEVSGPSEEAAQIVELQRRLADAELGREVDRVAVSELRENLKQMRDKRAEVEEEVRFYRGLMAPSEAQRGLRIEKLNLEKGEAPGQIRYRLLLTQIVDDHKWLKGQVQIDVVGLSNDRQQVLPLTELSTVEEYPLSFRFRYFQDLNGTLVVPTDFEPIRMVVTAKSSGGQGKRLQKNFLWNVKDG